MTSLEVNAQNEDSGPGGYAAARLLLLHEKERSGPPRRTALARLTDDWLAGLFAAAAPPRGTALVAVGGYGRSELSPRSDLDLLLLHDGTADKAAIAALADRIWYPVWDLGLALDHSVRTPAEARATAADDLKVHLGLLDARPLAGDAGLVAALRTTVLADWRNQAPRRLPELDALCRERAERMGELQFLLEPDLKEARGGLRDAQALRAVAASWLADAPREGLDRARRRLLDTRDALHLTTGRATDRLALQEQDAVAAELGLLDADTLLREVYEAARTISYATDVTWREVNRVLKARSARPRLRSLLGRTGAGRTGGKPPVERTPLAEGVVEMDGEVVLARTARPERDPVLPLRAAAAAAQSGLPLSPHAVRRLAATAPPLPAPWPAEAREELVTLLGAGEATVPVWEALEAEGIVTRLLPDWERVRCRPQRNPVHTWTVDRHLVETAVRAASLTRRVGRPDLLLVAALLHDIGKGWPGDHSVAGETIARDLAARVGFDRTDTATVATAVRHHLLLVETATRRDLDDPATVESVAAAVGTLGTLELLHALTEADALATGPAAWSSWRASLVADLVKRVAGVLAGEPLPDPEAAAPSAEQERLAIEALRTGEPVLALHTRDEHAADPDDSDPDDSASDEAAPEPVGVELVIALPDQPGVLPAVAGVLALHRLTVRAADLRAVDLPTGLGSGSVLVLDWRVAAEYGSLPEAARLRADLVRALDGSLDIPARLAEREAAYPRRRGLTAPPPRVTVAAADSRLATVIEVRAQDAPGLLHRIGRALEGAAVRVRSAHVSTLGANAVDTLYVTRPDGSLLPPEEAVDLARTLEAALG
ncbi:MULTISPECIES: [protein-PII] uridylyltransferase [Streptomyces]|uniref:[protein-PII] uridylyltransferase n=2 Tax=Streptomyces TaxID=1883 RepID=UPI000786C33E|nr:MULTISPECIES: [protein-PII] uridylyltransferase [unclassified Streptomyces]AVH95262.1 [protein-PII] uridylyltransferase [Streptomyces sp. WAC00288]KYG53954.1 protein-PII uridylyltransferase [Streptomyces sp. WAC04657]PVC73579.1 [protein-PII] uridylyltransferase [Streptomyces sp. CS081A]